MTVNIELQLYVTMLQTGDFGPIIRGDVTAEDLTTNEAKILDNFVRGYRGETSGLAKYPSLPIVKARFSQAAFILPDPCPADTIQALVHEVRINRAKADLRTIGQELLNAADSDDPITIAYQHSGTLRQMAAKSQPTRTLDVRNGLRALYENYESGNLIAEGIPWMWQTLQKHTRGIQMKEFSVISGRPKSRKTFTALAEVIFALMHGYRTLVFTPEMPPPQIMMRCAAMMAKIRYTEFKSAQLEEAEYMRFCEIVDNYGSLTAESPEKYAIKLRHVLAQHDVADDALPTLQIIQSTNKTVSWLESQIMAHGPHLVMVDSFYRQAAETTSKKQDETWRVTAISRALKDLAMEANVAILGTHQINRDGEDKIGSLANLALADAIGQDADIILRVITGKIDGQSVSGLVVLGGRELPIDGVLINNKPCIDFSEIGPITSKKEIADLMASEEREAAKDEAEKAKKATVPTGFAKSNGQTNFAQFESPVPTGAPPPDETRTVATHKGASGPPKKKTGRPPGKKNGKGPHPAKRQEVAKETAAARIITKVGKKMTAGGKA